MNLFLAQTDGVGAVAGLASLVSLLMFLSFFYSILCILVPIFIYRIMRNGTRAEEALLRIEQLLRYNKALTSQTPATPAAWAKGPVPEKTDLPQLGRLMRDFENAE